MCVKCVPHVSVEAQSDAEGLGDVGHVRLEDLLGGGVAEVLVFEIPLQAVFLGREVWVELVGGEVEGVGDGGGHGGGAELCECLV